MGMGVLRWLLKPLLWTLRRRRRPEDGDPDDRPHRKPRDRHGVYRIEVDSEPSHFRGDGPTFSFWASSRVILILSLLLWWIQPAGPMIAGYVGGRRAGAPWKAVVAALLPVVVILVANAAYSQNIAARQIDFVASLPLVVGDGAASILPFLAPYRDFMVAYLQGFVEALRATFGMGTNGYLMVIIFAYIGGLIGEQARRELASRSGAATSVGVNLFSPFLRSRARAEAEAEEGVEDEGGEPRPRRRPARAHAHGPTHAGAKRRRRRHGSPEAFEEFHRVDAEAVDERGGHRAMRTRHARARGDEQDEEEEEQERARRPAKARSARARPRDVAPEEPPRPEVREKRPVRPRSHEEEVKIQRFVERALRSYDRAKL